MLTTMASFMPIYTGLPEERFVHISKIGHEDAKDFPTFVEECINRGVTLIAWDSRLAGRRDDLYYKRWGIDRIEILGLPFNGGKIDCIERCKLIHLIGQGWPKMAVYRIMPSLSDAYSKTDTSTFP